MTDQNQNTAIAAIPAMTGFSGVIENQNMKFLYDRTDALQTAIDGASRPDEIWDWDIDGGETREQYRARKAAYSAGYRDAMLTMIKYLAHTY